MSKSDKIRKIAKIRHADRALGRMAGRVVVILFLLAVGLAGGPRVHAMGAADGLVATVICAESGTRTIYLGADGAPARQGRDCAECPLCLALSGPALTSSGQALPLRLARRSSARRRQDAVMPATRNRRPKSRGPPALTVLNGTMESHILNRIDDGSAHADATDVKSAGASSCHHTWRHNEDVQR